MENFCSSPVYLEFLGFLYVHGISFFRLGKFSSIILSNTFTGSLSWESLFFSIPSILSFGLLIVYEFMVENTLLHQQEKKIKKLLSAKVCIMYFLN